MNEKFVVSETELSLRSWTDLVFPKRLGAADAIYQNYAQLGTDSADPGRGVSNEQPCCFKHVPVSPIH